MPRKIKSAKYSIIALRQMRLSFKIIFECSKEDNLKVKDAKVSNSVYLAQKIGLLIPKKIWSSEKAAIIATAVVTSGMMKQSRPPDTKSMAGHTMKNAQPS